MSDAQQRPAAAGGTVLEIQDLTVTFGSDEAEIRAVDGVSLVVNRARTTALVGESGCGKTLTGHAILRLIDPPGRIAGGRILFFPTDGAPIDITALDDRSETLLRLRGGRIGMVFQEPMSALSPVHRVGSQIGETVRVHRGLNRVEARRQAVDLLRRVGIPAPERRVDQYPFEMSGGMRQRVMVALALACDPDLVIADEPTTALDVTLQAQIIRLMKTLQRESGTAFLLITHDMGVVAQMADDVAVMYLGQVVETAPARDLLKRPCHPYTRALLSSLPILSPRRARLPAIEGSVPSAAERPSGCSFHPRCPHARGRVCDTGAPPPLEPVDQGRRAACFRIRELGEKA